MYKFLLVTLLSILLLGSCYGCSFIKEHFLQRGTTKPNNNQQQEEQQRETHPIPTNPQHS